MGAKNRILQFESPLGEKRCIPVCLKGTERLNALFSFELTLMAGDDPIEPEELLGEEVVITVSSGDLERNFCGIVSQFREVDPTGDDTFEYIADVVPRLWLLGLNSHNRIFEEMDALAIVEQVVQESCEMPVQRAVTKPCTVRETCCQFNETDLAFVQRLLAEEGIAFCFSHGEREAELILADSLHGLPDSSPGEYPYKEREESDWKSRVSRFKRAGRLCTAKLSSTDYSEYAASRPIEVEDELRPGREKSRQGEMTLHGRHNFESGGTERILKQGTCSGQVKRWLNGLESAGSQYTGVSGAVTFTAGHKFELSDTPVVANKETQFLLMAVTHEAADGYDEKTFYRNSFVCTAASNPTAFTPTIIPERPRIWGPQTARVIEVENPEAAKAHGRVKVLFPWDSEQSSCWARVAQLYAGNKWGGFFIPDIDQEVLVECINGDPDRPVVVGAVYNNDNAVPPYSKWQSGIRTRPGDYNELRFDDNPGQEEVYFQAGRDHKFLIQNDESGEVLNDQTLEIGGKQKITVEGDIDYESKGSINIKAGRSLEIEATTNITLKVGGNKITLGPEGITIKGSLVTVKSNAMTEVSSSGILKLQGALTKIN